MILKVNFIKSSLKWLKSLSLDSRALKRYQIVMNKYRGYSLDKPNAVLVKRKLSLKRQKLFSTLTLVYRLWLVTNSKAGIPKQVDKYSH